MLRPPQLSVGELMNDRDDFLRDRLPAAQPGAPVARPSRPQSRDPRAVLPPGFPMPTPARPPAAPRSSPRPPVAPPLPPGVAAPPQPGSWADIDVEPPPIPPARRPSRGWRHIVRVVTLGLVGPSAQGRREAEYEAATQAVLHGNYKVGVLGKGGFGKTSVAASVGSIFAELRRRDRVVAIDAETAFGRLGSRIDPRASGSYWDLTASKNLQSFADVSARRQQFRRSVCAGRGAGGRSAPGARSGDLPGSRATAGPPFHDLDHRLRFVNGCAGHPGSAARSGCADRGVLTMGGWGLGRREDHGVAG